MRDVACAGSRAGDAAPANTSVAAIAVESVLVILLPKRFGPQITYAKARASRGAPRNALKRRSIFCGAAIRARRAAGPDLPGAADFAGPFTGR